MTTNNTFTTPAGYTAPTTTTHTRAHDYTLRYGWPPSRVTDRFTDLGVSLTPEVQAGLDQQTAALAQLAKFEAPNKHMEDAAQAVLDGTDPTDHLTKASVGNKAEELREAVTRKINGILSRSINTNADQLIRNLGTEAFAPTIRELTALHEKWNLRASGSALVANGEFDHAKAVHRAGELITKLNKIIEARSAVHHEGFRWASAYVRETNGLDVIHNYLPETLDEWVTLLDHKRTFWFPTISEALHLKDWHDKEGTRQLDAQAAREKETRAKQAESMRS